MARRGEREGRDGVVEWPGPPSLPTITFHAIHLLPESSKVSVILEALWPA